MKKDSGQKIVGSGQSAVGRMELQTDNCGLRAEMSETFPKGWYIGSLDEIVNSVKTGVPEFKGEKEYYSTGSIQGNSFIPEESFSFKNKPSRANRIAIKDDVFQARMKETDKGLIADDKLSEQLFSTGFLQLRPYGETYSSKLLYYYIISPNFLNQKNDLATGSTQEALTDNNAANLSFPLLPLNEQKRIVAKLDKIMPRIDAVKERLDKVPVIVKRFRQSVLTAAVTGKLTEKWRVEHLDVESAELLLERIKKDREIRYKKESEIAKKTGKKKPKKPENISPLPVIQEDQELPISWISATFKDISSTEQYSMTSGPFGSALGTKDYQIDGIPVIRGQNIQPAEFNSSNYVFISDKKANELKRSQAKSGDIVIVAVGAGVGNSAIVPTYINNAILSQNCNKFTVDTELVTNRYILSALQISIIRTQMDESTTDTARQFLSLTNLKKMIFPLPPLEEQKEIVLQVDKLFALADRLESHYQKAKVRVDKLSQSVLAKAFRGELVITEAEFAEKEGRDFENAEKLLERILEEKAKITKSLRKNK